LTREYKELFLFGADYYAEKIPDRNSGGWLVWDKRTEEKFDPRLGSNFELIWSKKKHKRELIRVLWTGVFGMQNQDVRKRQHPTQKPLGVIEWIIKKYGDETIEDFYLGSGTTLIACERLDRQCRAVEISPAYVAVALERWHEYTGELPELIED